MVQKQKQKQSVVINIGEVVKKKRRRRRVQKKRPLPPQYYSSPPPPPPQDFAKVIYPVNVLQPDENIKIQLNAVTKQLADLEEKQRNRTANLMAGIRAEERQAQQQLGVEVEPTQEQLGIATEAAPAPAQPETVIIRRKKKKSAAAEPEALQPIQAPAEPAVLQPVQTPEETADLSPPVSFVGPLPRFTSSPTPSLQTEPPGQLSVSPSPTPRRGRPPGRKPSKSRSDKGIPRGQLFRTASAEAIAQGYALAAIRTGGGAAEPPPSQVTWLTPPSAAAEPKL